MATLEELLAYMPDNDSGEIDAADLRAVITGVWEESATLFAATQGALQALDARLTVLEQAGGSTDLTVGGAWQVNPQAGAVPGGMQVTTDTGDPTTATWLRFSTTDQSNTDKRNVLLTCTHIYGQQQGDSTNWARMDVTGTATDQGSFVEIPATFVSGGGSTGAAQWQSGAFVFTIPTGQAGG